MDGEPSPFVSRVVKATKGSTSLRVTVPQVVAATLGLHAGDELRWVVDAVSGAIRVEKKVERSYAPEASAPILSE
jgi:hypothetical protein